MLPYRECAAVDESAPAGAETPVGKQDKEPDMKITEISTFVLEAALSETFIWAFDQASSRTSCVVRIRTDEGIVGWGECLGPAAPIAGIVAFLSDRLVGQDPLATDRIWEQLYSGTRDQGRKGLVLSAISGIDIALWDIRGKFWNAPVHRLMGGPLRTRVRAYATGTYRRAEHTGTDYILDEVSGYVQQGFTGLKLKIGFGVHEDVELIRATRARLGKDVALMLDANHGYDRLEAIALGNAVADCDIGWLEEPVIPEDLHAYAEVRLRQPIPLSGGETEFTRWGFRDVLAAKAMDILQPDVCAAGGLSECKKIIDMAAAHGVRCIPHVWGTAIGMSAALQLLAVIPHQPLRHTPLEPWLEFDRSEHPFREAVSRTRFELVDGYVDIPQGPGLGIEIDEDSLVRFVAGGPVRA